MLTQVYVKSDDVTTVAACIVISAQLRQFVRLTLKVGAKRVRVTIIACILSIFVAGSAHGQNSCGDPPRVDDETLKGDLEGKAQFLSKLIGDSSLKGQIDAARTDIFSKYPDAAQAHSDTYLEYMFCTFVMADTKLSALEKLQAILIFRSSERGSPKVGNSNITGGCMSPIFGTVTGSSHVEISGTCNK